MVFVHKVLRCEQIKEEICIMSNLIPAQRLADVARSLVEGPTIPYKSPGRSLSGMDASGFIAYCFGKLGILIRATGTNSLLREIRGHVMPLQAAIREGNLVPGALLFHILIDGKEPAQYKGDGLGNATFALICLDSDWAAYPSPSKGKLIVTPTKFAPGRANVVVLHPALAYSVSPALPQQTNPMPPTFPPPLSIDTNWQQMIVIGGGLNLRQTPDKKGKYILQMLEGSVVLITDIKDGWARTIYTTKKGQTRIGFAMTKYMQKLA